MHQSANIRSWLRPASLSLTGVLLACSQFIGHAPPALAALTAHDGYATHGARIQVTATDFTPGAALNGHTTSRQTNNSHKLDARSTQSAASILVSRNSSKRITNQKRNPSLELYEKRRISPPISPRRRPDVNLINPQKRAQPPNYRDRIKRNRNNRILPPSRLGRDPLSSSSIDCRGGIIRQGSCHCRGRDVLREVAGNVYACVTRPLD